MRKLLIVLLLLAFLAVTLWGIEAAASGTHEIMGDSGYHPFISIREYFK